MSDWNIGLKYDYRFAALMLQIWHENGASPVYHITLKDILNQVPLYEVRAALEDEYQSTEPGGDNIDAARIRLLESVDWKGKTVLDIGGYDGFAAEIAYKGGAGRAICLDNHQYEHYGWKDKKKENVEYIQGDFMDLKFQTFGATIGDHFVDISMPDVIIFYNVLYHLHNPWAGLDHLRTLLKPGGEMLLCSLFRYHEGPWMYVYEPRECNKDDETVFFGPSLDALERLLKLTGWSFERYALAYDRVLYRCKPVENFVPVLAAEGYARS